jgi:hypothetical protein
MLAREEKRREEDRAPNGPRLCGWCKGVGHNKRTCPTLRRDREDKRLEIKDWRDRFCEVAEQHGFGLGSLMKIKNPDRIESLWDRQHVEDQIARGEIYGFVSKFSGKKLSPKLEQRNQSCVQITFTSGKTAWSYLPGNFSELLSSKAHCKYDIVGKIDASSIRWCFDHDWRMGSDMVNELLGLEDN